MRKISLFWYITSIVYDEFLLSKNLLYRRSHSGPSDIARSWWIQRCRLCLTCSRWTLLLLLCTVLRRLILRGLQLLASHRYNMYCYLLHVLILLRRESNVLILQHSGCFYWAKEKGVQWDRLCCGVNKIFWQMCVVMIVTRNLALHF